MKLGDVDLGRSEFLRVRGLRYHLRRWGDPGKPLLFLLHGWLDVSATFAPVAQRLAAHAQVIAPDWRGVGYSQWAPGGYWFIDNLGDFDAIVDHYAPQGRFHIVGHSMGGQVASLYAGLRPQRVERLAIVDGLRLPEMPAPLAPQKLMLWLDQLRRPASDRSQPSFEALAERIRVHHPRLSAEQALFVARCWARQLDDGRVVLLADPAHHRVEPRLYRNAEAAVVWRLVSAPTLFVLAGLSDSFRGADEAEMQQRYACFRDHRVVRFDDVGHMIHFEAPERLAATLADFLFAAP